MSRAVSRGENTNRQTSLLGSSFRGFITRPSSLDSSSLLRECDPHLGLVILDVLAAHVDNDSRDGTRELEWGLVLGTHRRARIGTDDHRAALGESNRRRYRKLAVSDLLAVYGNRRPPARPYHF